MRTLVQLKIITTAAEYKYFSKKSIRWENFYVWIGEDRFHVSDIIYRLKDMSDDQLLKLHEGIIRRCSNFNA